MADQQNLDNVKADLWEVWFGAERAPYEARLSLAVALNPIEVTSMRTGKDVLKAIVGGRSATLSLTFIQATKAEIKTFLNITAGAAPFDLPAVGSTIPVTPVRLHDPAAADATDDIVLYAGAIVGMNLDGDGEGVKEPVVQLRGLRDANGKVLRVDNATA